MRLFRRRAEPVPARLNGRPVVAVTGAAGRIGTACLRALAHEPVDVIAIDQVAGDGPGEWRRADLRTRSEAVAALRGATHLIHLAARSGPGREPASPVLVDNVTITANVLDAFVAGLDGAGGTAVLASSVTVYGIVWPTTPLSPVYVPVDEDHPCRPSEPYSVSKLAAEALAAMWSRSAGITTVSMRIPWTAGDEPERIRALLDVIAADPTGDLAGRHLWSYVHVDDVASAMVAALAVADGAAHVLNIVSPEVIGGGRPSELMAARHPGTQVRGAIDDGGLYATGRARDLLGWRPTRSLLTARVDSAEGDPAGG